MWGWFPRELNDREPEQATAEEAWQGAYALVMIHRAKGREGERRLAKCVSGPWGDGEDAVA